MVGDSFKVGEQVGEDKSHLDGTFAVLKAENVLGLEVVLQIIDDLFKRLNGDSKLQIVFLEGGKSDVKYLVDSVKHCLELGLCRF